MLIGRYYRLSLAPAPAAPPASSIAAWSYAQLPTATGLADEKNTGDARGVQPGYAISFDGVDDHVNCGDIFSKERTDAFSISLWAKYSTTAEDSFVSRQLSSTPFRGFDLRCSSGAIKLVMNAVAGSDAIILSTVSSFNDNQWHHIALTYDGSSLASGVTIYVDSSEQSLSVTQDNLSSSIVAAQNLMIGKRGTDSTYVFTGSIHGVELFDSELSQADVSNVISSPASAPTRAHWYKLEESTGTTAYDSSGNGNHGTLVNGPTYTATGEVSRSWANDVGYSDMVPPSSSDLTTWTASQCTVASGQSDPDGGSSAFLVTSTGSDDSLYLVGEIVTGEDYEVEVWARADSAGSVFLGGHRNDVAISNITTTWQKFTISVDGAINSFLYALDMRGATTLSSVYLYGIRYKRISNPVIVPRDESDTDNDVLGSPLTYSGAVPRPSRAHSSPCRVWDGVDDHLVASHLSGSETVVSSGGTSTPTVSAGRIDFTAGTCWDLVLSDGTRYVMSETGGTACHTVDGTTNHATYTGGPTVGTQDEFHWGLSVGYTGANEIPARADKSLAADGSAISAPAVVGHNAASTSLDFTSGQPNDPAIDTYVLTLDGTDDHVTPELRVTNTGSVTQVFASCWVKFSGTQNEKHIQGEYRTTSSHRQWRLATTPDGTTVEAQVYANGGATTYKAYGFSTALNDDKWHHVAMYFNAGVLKIYLNGLEEASPVQRRDGTVNSIWNGIAQYAIGAGNSSISASDFFAGDVQQCRVYIGSNAADAATNVAGIYEETYTGTPEAVYDLRNSLLDTSGNGDDLVAYGSPSFSRILPPTDYTFDSGLPLHMRRLKYSSVREAEYYIKG